MYRLADKLLKWESDEEGGALVGELTPEQEKMACRDYRKLIDTVVSMLEKENG